MFSVRIVTTDHYMSPPLRGLDVQYADQRGSEVKKVPVVRIFGATPAGQKTCMHVHGVFPYLYVPYDGTAPWDRYLRQFASSLDKAINVAQGYGQSTIQHVYKIVLVSGTAMYGYHDKEQQFLKIYLYNPAMIRKAADLLLGGAVLNKAFQPHEAHIPYTLQLFIDYNLYGMNMINVGAVKFRRRDKDDNGNPVIVRDVSFRGSQESDEGLGSDPRTPVSFTGLLNRSGSATPSRRTWDYENIPSELYLDPDVERLSTCELEVDVVAADILNRLEVNTNVGANPGLAALWEDERQRCRDRGQSTDIAPPGSPERVDIEMAESEVHLDNQLHEIVLQQMAYMDSQSQSQEEESQEAEVPATPASAIELHFSQIEDESMSSQETVILDEEPDEKPIVNLESIHRVVSSSQSFCEVKPRTDDGEVEDKSLVDILASLAKESDTPPVSQVAAETQVAALEEQDSILSQVSQPRDDDVERKEAEEVLEMSQRIWDEDMTLTSPDDTDSPVKPEVEEYDLAGLDETWQESQVEEKLAQESDNSESGEDYDSDVIPQLDGPADEKPKEPKKRGPKRLGVSGPVRYMPRDVPAMPQQMHQGYMNSQPYPGVPPNQQYSGHYYGNYGATQNYRQWNPGMQQNSGIQHGPGMVHNPHMQQHPGPRMQNPGLHQGPGMMQNPPMQKNPSMQHSPGMQQSQLAQNSIGMPQSHSMKQMGTLNSPGAVQRPGFEQIPGMLQSHVPGTQQSPGTLQSPEIQRSPGMIQSQGIKRSTGSQQSPGVQQNQGMLQSPHMQQSPDNQLSQSIMQSPTGNFSPPSATGWDQEQTYSMQNSPPLVNVYGNDQKSQYAADLNSNQNSNQYQHNPASTYGYHPSQTTQGTYAGSVLRSEISKYNQRAYPSQNQRAYPSQQQQVSPGYQPSAPHTQHSYQPSQMSPGYNKPQNLHAGVAIQQAYSAPQNFSQTTSETHQRNTSVARTVPHMSVSAKNTNISSSNTPQITHWQQRASALASKSQQRFQSPQSVVGSPRYQVSTSTALPSISAAGNYVEYERTPKPVETYFSQASLVQKAMPVSHMSDRNISGNACDSVKPTGSSLDRNSSLSQRHMSEAKANISASPISPGSHGYSTVMTSPCSESGTVTQPASNMLGNVAFSKSTNSLANIDALSQRSNSQDWNVTSPEPLPTGNYDSFVNNEPKSSKLYARKQLLYPQQGVSQGAQNIQNEAQKSSAWKNLSNTQSYITSAVPNVQGNQRTLSNLEMKMNQTKVPEPNKTSPKALKPPVEGPISRYYRLKRENGAAASAASEDVKSPESEKQTSQQSTPLSSPVNTSDRHDSALHKLLLEQQAINPVVVQDAVNPLDIDDSSTENRQSVSDKNSSLTSLLLEEDSKEPIVWQNSGIEDQLFSHKNVAPNKHSSSNSTGVNLSANLNDSQEDLFADASQKSSKGHIPVNESFSLTRDSSFANENTDDDSSVSVFSDGLDSKDMGQFQIGANQVASTEAVGEVHKRSFHSKSLDLPKHSDLSSLSDLKHFVGSVQKESDYGASFQKSDIPIGSDSKCSTSVSNMNVNEALAAGSYQQAFVKSPESINTLQQSQPNLMQSPDMMLPKPKRKYTRKNPNLPPIKRSVSVPAIPGLKRKRGRPRKESFSVQVPSSVQDLIKSNNYHENFHPQQYDLSFQNQQFQQQTYNQQNYSEPVFYPEPSYQNQVPYQEPSFFPQQDMQPQSSFLKELMAESDSFEFQKQSSCSDSFSSESTEKTQFVEQSENNAEKAAFVSQNETVENVKKAHDASYNYSEMHRRANQEMQAFHKQQEMLSQSVLKSQPIWRSAAQKEKLLAERKSELSCHAVTQHNVAATTCTSPAYTFQFKVPTPVYKRLKLRLISGIRETVNKFEIVRMHPKDARKYSLMKIGSEIVKLHKLSRNEIERIQEDLLLGKEVLGLPPALRQVEIAQIDNSALQNELSETLLSSLEENQAHLTQLYQDENNIHIQRKHRKNSDSLFKNRNIANIPHLKKYRAGFPYFGKGNVGKKVPSKQAHPVLSPELEEDNEVVIKDVSLTDASEGTLTPIKSRTPITGRSPAHSGGHILETENKEYLENKLKDFAGELELTSQANEQQMFVNESDLFDDQKPVDEYEGSTDSDGNDAPMEVEEEPSNKTDLLEKSSVAVKIKENDNTDISEILQQSKMAVEGENNETVSENELESDSLDEKLENKFCNKGNELSSKDSVKSKDCKVIIEEIKEPGIQQELVDKFKQENTKDVLLESKECSIGSLSEISGTAVCERELKSRSRSNSYESFSSSKSSSRRESLSNSNDFGRPKRQSSVESYVAQMLEKSKGKRKRSSSNSSQNINTCKSSFEDQENNHKRRKKHSKKKKKKKHRNHNDSDSDGIPGVDYIVVGRFKGHKEMRVVLHKIDADKLDSLSAEEMILTQSEKEKTVPKRRKSNSGDEDDISCPPNASIPNATIQSHAFTGFSAEFEKFLAQARGGNNSNNKTQRSRKPFTQMPRPHTNVFGNPESKPNSEDSSSKGESATRSSTTENSDGSANEHGESSSSDMCLSTNHSVSYQNVPAFSSAGELNIFLGELADKNNKTDSENGFRQKRLHLSVKSKHSHKTKKRNTIHDRMSRAFVGRKRKKHSSRKPTKLMNSLSVLHNATMEKLTEDNKLGPIKLKINLKSLRRYPDYELYSDDVDSDYDAPYCDTMYKLAWYSPPESETGDLSPPQPLSPEQMTDQDFNNLENPQKTVYHTPLSNKYATTPTKNEIKCFREDRLSLLDVKKTVNSANSPLMGEKQDLKEQRLTLADIQKSIKNANSSDVESEKVFREERVTLADIQKTMLSANSSEMEGEKGLKEEKLTISHIKKVMNQANTSADTSDNEMDSVSVSHPKTIESDIKMSTDDHISNNVQSAGRNNQHNENLKEIPEQVKLLESQPFEDIGKSQVKTADVHAYGNQNFENVAKQGLDLSEKLESRVKENQFARVPLAHLPPLTVTDDLHKLPTDDERESVHSNKSNEENISPPDLGPPNIPRFSPRQYPDGNCRSDPPLLTISKESLYVDTDSEIYHSAIKSNDTSECLQINEMDRNSILNTPPNLIPCKSPGSQSYSSASPRHPYVVPVKDCELKQSSEHSKRRPGHSPAACSSSGSINVIHSEEFSDISDEDSDDDIICSQNNQVYDKNCGMPALSITRHNIMNYLQNSGTNTHQGNSGKNKKLKEIAEFEKHMHEKDCLEYRKATEENQINKDLLKDSVRELERKHQYEAVNLSKSNTSSNGNIGSPEFKRRHSVPLYNSNYNVASYSEGSYSERSRTLSQGPYQSNMTFNYNKPNLESCKFTQIRQEHFNVSATNPKFMTLDCVSQNGFRNPILQNGSYENRNSFRISEFEMTHIPKMSETFERPLDRHKSLEGSALYSPPHLHHNLVHGHISNSPNCNRNNSSNFERNNRNLFSDCTQNMLSVPNVLANVGLSESNKTSYSICRNRRISDSIIRSVTNHNSVPKEHLMNSVQFNTQYHNDIRSESSVPCNQFGTGGNKNVKHTKMKQSGGENESGSNLSEQDESGHSSERGGGDTGPNGNNRGTDKHGSLEMLAGCQVITPLTAPPTRECVYESANQFGLPSVQSKEAFYGNPKDAPEKPREGGGQLLKVSSNMEKTLNEFETRGKSEGLINWRNSFCAKENLFSSQRDESLSDKLVLEPALKYALTGDRKIVVTPCLLPPSKCKVKEWLKGRKLYKVLKKKLSVIPTVCAEDTGAKISESKDELSKARDSESAVADQSKPGEVCLNLFTGKREVIHEASDLSDKDVPPVLVREEPYHGEEEFNEESESRQRGDESELEISPPFKQKKLDDSSQLHSTPMTRRSSSDLFESGCTPIVSDRVTPTMEVDDKKEEEPSGFVTPKRIRPPLRRLSTNTESTLRRAIITTQMKQQFCTPALQKEVSQIDGPTPKNSFGFKVSQQNFQDAKALHENQYLTVVSLELHVETRGDLRPDPEFDSIQGIFYSIFNDVPPERGARHETGAIIVDAESANQNQASSSAASKVAGDSVAGTSMSHDPVPGTSKSHDPASSASKAGPKDKMTVLQKSGVAGLEVTYVKNETELLQTFIDYVKKWDPDILVGYEIQQLSWGYLLQRASTVNTNLAVAISRVPTSKTSSHMSAAKDEYGADHNSEIHIAGRIVLNLWRLMRHEVTLNVYTFENVAFHVLHRRVPSFSFRNLASWYKHKTHLHRWKVINHYVTRVKGNLEMMEQLDLIGRTSEFARVFGIEFYHVLSRGSQYRVESMMLRVAKPMNYIPVSPNVHQRARMKAPECIPLTLEPQSRFYTDPVVVLDFQSLYPSIMIAYNYCFSTCMGRVDWLSKAHEGPIEFGCTSLNNPPRVLKKHQDKITYSPNGVAFVKQSVKRGVLPVMVEEILNTRLMVKKAMKSYKGDKTLSRMLDARQLGLKLIANVTYGYTAANFSGRMPCIEVADSIVRKARETLERSIKLVEETPKWGAKVIYGDTDSMFLLMKGKSKDEAFKIGQEIADTVTKMFPKPIKLKFEKVYLPCVLQTKKRYVGFMYETPDQKEPVYDAKGIETVRRDSCQAVSKVLERSIKILFQTRDVSQVKSYVQHQCQKLMEGTVSLQDCIFAKEFRGMSGYKPGACVPALEIAKKLIRQDRRAEPRVGERVPYVIVYGSPGLPLIQLVKQPMELLQDGSLRLNSTYYITKQILPPLSRFLSLLGADVFSWYQEMPHSGARAIAQAALPQDSKKGTISQYFATSNCPICDQQTKQPICQRCMREPQMVCVTLSDKITRWERLQEHLNKVCSICIGCTDSGTVKSCTSLDCPILYRQSRAQRDFSRADNIREILNKVFS